ncbi:Ctf8-domain-containing protein [Myxozyma melibiosi]|uniref:Ctf8-domain-containing protein n=1 Tax=Myxozyma melibiosi TaxID=54550 RepID=A0ABR1EYS2_9ASCO
MPSATLSVTRPSIPSSIPNLPQVLQTPSGLALVEIQGTLHLSTTSSSSSDPLGRLVFEKSTVWLYIGNHQRMEGAVVDLKPPVGLLRRQITDDGKGEHGAPDGEAVEIVEVIRKKIVFSTRPEPLVQDVSFRRS